MRLCIRAWDRSLEKSFAQRVADIAKGGNHKYVRREGSPGNYKYYYRLPDGSIGTKDDLKGNQKGKQKTELGSGKEKNEYPDSVAVGDTFTGADAYTGKLASGTVHAVGEDKSKSWQERK